MVRNALDGTQARRARHRITNTLPTMLRPELLGMPAGGVEDEPLGGGVQARQRSRRR
jgi:hypothetical protein